MVVLKTDDGVYGEGEARGGEEREEEEREGEGRLLINHPHEE